MTSEHRPQQAERANALQAKPGARGSASSQGGGHRSGTPAQASLKPQPAHPSNPEGFILGTVHVHVHTCACTAGLARCHSSGGGFLDPALTTTAVDPEEISAPSRALRSRMALTGHGMGPGSPHGTGAKTHRSWARWGSL